MNATEIRRQRALLLDDDPVVLRLLGTALEARGFEVVAATDGEGGVALLIDELLDLDVVVVDDDLPARDASSLLHLVRRAGGERDLAVVVLAPSGAATRERLLELGADAVVDRADGPGAALAAVETALARRPAECTAAAAGSALRRALVAAGAALGAAVPGRSPLPA